MINIGAPILQIFSIIGAALTIAFFGQTNKAYKLTMIILIAIFMGAIFLGFAAFLAESTGFYAFGIMFYSIITGALRLFIYEFITEIIFPVSPCFGLAIMHGLSGLLSLLIQMLADDLILKDPTNVAFPIIIFSLCFAVSAFALFVFVRYPYKLNRSDFDHGRRQTMVTNYSINGGYRKGAPSGAVNINKSSGDAHAD